MTARRQSRTSAGVAGQVTQYEDQFRRLLDALNRDWTERQVGGNLQETVGARIRRLARDISNETVSQPLHPALTDYGPDSAATFFRQTRANKPPTRQRSPASPGGRIRPRNDHSFRARSGSLSNSPTPSDRHTGDPREHLELLKSPVAERRHRSQTLAGCTDAEKIWGRTFENSQWDDENLLPSQRKGPKRARRKSNREQAADVENPPQTHNPPHGAALLRGMRLGSVTQRNQDDLIELNQTNLPSQDGRAPAENSPAVSPVVPRADSHNRPVSAEAWDDSMQDGFQATGRHIQAEDDDDAINQIVTSVACLDSERETPLVRDQSRTFQISRSHHRRTSLFSRRSALTSPARSARAHRDILGSRIARAFLQRNYEQDFDADSTSSQDGSTLDAANASLRQIIARHLSGSSDGDESEDVMTPFLEHLMVLMSSTEHKGLSLLPSALTATIAERATPHHTSYRYDQIIPSKTLGGSHWGEAVASSHRISAQRPDGSEPVSSQEASTSRNGPTLLQPGSTSRKGPASTREPPFCRPEGTSCGWPVMPTEIYFEISRYLSRQDALNLRLVCRDFSVAMMGPVFGSVVVPFGKAMYDLFPTAWEGDSASVTMFQKYGLAIRKFGIAFEADAGLIAQAGTKTISNEQSSWWGKYKWPTPVYPRFNHLFMLENLADNVPCLKSAMANLGKTHELALSVDSGHGWLNGPDISDMALFSLRCGNDTKVFGRNLSAEDKQKHTTRGQLFECAQAKTLQDCTEILQMHSRLFPSSDVAFMESVAVRDLESFRKRKQQPDFDVAAHAGGSYPTSTNAPNIGQPPVAGQHQVVGANQAGNAGLNAGLQNLGAVHPFHHLLGQHIHNQFQQGMAPIFPVNFANAMFPGPPTQPNIMATHLPAQDHHGFAAGFAANTDEGTSERRRTGFIDFPERPQMMTQPQFPLIFNGCNLAAEVGGWCHLIQNKVAAPSSFPLQPGTLTEAQAQWLMETVWAQRAFLSAYTTSILATKACFAQVHSLHIAKMSSGLLSALEQKELWLGLPGLTHLTVLVSPDWRVEHITGDQSFNSNMLVSPVDASLQLTQFLKSYIAPLEKLSDLTIGFVGGGEHATGIMARNQHVLPAPITSAPRTWLSNHIAEPDGGTMNTFNHIKHLTVQNAWFSPLMLEEFLIRSRDTSLRSLTLDSVSLSATHSQRLIGPLTTGINSLDTLHPPSMWLHEVLPTTHCWPAIIDRITPGRTFLDQKYDAGMIADPYSNPRPSPSFRGFVSRLEFKSCGYVRIGGVPIQDFNQNDLVCPNHDPMDMGLKARAAALAEKGVMLSDKNPSTGAEWPLLGRLTQCIHPVEKRVLEQAWRMKFGWGDDLERWAAVEDGCFEGGTGRFSGVVVGQGGKGIDTEGA